MRQVIGAFAAPDAHVIYGAAYDDTLGDAPADSFEGLIRWDVERIVAALR